MVDLVMIDQFPEIVIFNNLNRNECLLSENRSKFSGDIIDILN